MCILSIQQFSNKCKKRTDYFYQVSVCKIGCQSRAFFSANSGDPKSNRCRGDLFTHVFARFVPSCTFVVYSFGSVIDMGHVNGQMELLWFWFARSRFYPNTTLISVIRSVFLCLYRTMLEHVDSRIW